MAIMSAESSSENEVGNQYCPVPPPPEETHPWLDDELDEDEDDDDELAGPGQRLKLLLLQLMLSGVMGLTVLQESMLDCGVSGSRTKDEDVIT